MTEYSICTIITKSYLAYARVLAKSLLRHNPESKLYVLLADQLDGYFEPDKEPFQLILLEDLPDQALIRKMSFYYTTFEFCCALRGMLHEYMWNHTNAEKWLFLDSDIMIFGCLNRIYQQLEKTSILLSPHNQNPAPKKHIEIHEINFICSGVYNGGFLGLNRTETTKSFISWFRDRLAYYCFDDRSVARPRGLFVDQSWLHLVPIYFPDYQVISAAGANLGHWNLFERALEKTSSGEVIVNGEPLLFVHFSGWDINQPQKISKHAPIYDSCTASIWNELAEEYRNLLLVNEYNKTQVYPYAFNHFIGGQKIRPAMRRIYHEACVGERMTIDSDPFHQYNYFRDQDPETARGIKPFLRRQGKQVARKMATFLA